MDWKTAHTFINTLLINKVGRELRSPEIVVFEGTWQGMTYEQMADSSTYSANYLMRDIAPKFWKLLSKLLGKNVGKTNLRLVIKKIYHDSPTELIQSLKLDLKNQQKHFDWGKAPTIPSHYYGYHCQLQRLQQWVAVEHCQLLSLWGASGVGKTLLMKKFAQQIQDRFEVVIWRSLENAPSLSELLRDILHSGFNVTVNEDNKLLLELAIQLQTRSCLILLDGIEAIFQTKAISGTYLSGYEDYQEFWRVVAESSHQSCVVFTSLENPGKIVLANNSNSLARSLKLSGLEVADAQSLLEAEAIVPADTATDLVKYYQGNPAILNTVTKIAQELFNGNVSEFLAQNSLVFGEINHFLLKSFERLCTLEQELLYWLAIQERSLSLPEIQARIPFAVYSVELIEALESLSQRSLLTVSQIEKRTVFVLSAMIREFVINQFIAKISNNFSVASRQNCLSNNNKIELSTKNQQLTHLNHWLENRFELGWQPFEALFTPLDCSPARLRSVFNLRDKKIIKRFKQIELEGDKPTKVLLIIAISPEEEAISVCVQTQPASQEQILPENLQLNLKDTSNHVLATTVSEAEDDFIQLPYFRGVLGEHFQINLNLNSVSYQENFLI